MTELLKGGEKPAPGRKSLLGRMRDQVKSDFGEYLSSPDGDMEESPAFQTHAVAKTMQITRIMAVVGAANIVFWAPTDLWVYRGTPSLIRWLFAFRVMTLITLASVFLVFSTTAPIRQTAWRIIAWYWIVVGSIFGLFGYISDPSVPLLYTALITPAATAAFLVPLRMRFAMNIGGFLVFLLSYFGPHPDYWTYRYADMLIVDMAFACVLGILLGHFMYRLERTAFAQRRAIQQHAAELEELDRTKDSFVATMSHELRTPLNSIIGLTDVVLDEKLAPEVKGYVRTIRKSGEVLQRLINDVLDLAKIRAGKLEMERRPFALQDVVENCVSLFTVASEEKGIDLVYDVPWELPELVGDEGRVGQILINLIGNAVKFTATGEVMVVVEWRPASAGREPAILLRVTDTGPGIPDEKKESIFEEFVQVDASTARRFGGTGLGLPIVRRLSHLMGGEVAIADNTPHGAVFTVTLPVEVAAEPREPPPKLPQGIIMGGQTVVACAAHPLSRRHLVDSIAHLGLPVEGAESEEATVRAVQRLRSEGREVGAIVVKPRSMSASQFARSPLQMVGARIPIVLIANSRAASDDTATLRNMGARAVLFRPARRAELRDTLVAALSGEMPGPKTLSVPPRRGTALSTRILVIDDVADNRALLQAFVKDYSIQLDAAGGAEEGLALFHQHVYDAVFLDIQMPGMDGYAVIDRMHDWERDHHREPTPIIALTAHVTAEHQLRIRQHGFTQHLTKPLRKKDFLNTLADLGQSPIAPPMADDAITLVPNDLSHLLPGYFHNRRQDTVALLRHLGDRNFHEIGRIGHKLQGSGGSYGFHDISAIGTRMEEAAARGDVNELRVAIAELESTITRHYGNA